ncbi:P-loop NTPase fold protein [Myroides odoratus]
MTHPTKIKIPNDSIITEFKEHLDLEFNQRILFTAPFGAGKSTFINDFEDQYKNEYRFIRLYPVNYAVSGNEDIFELIKFDILYELMNKYLKEIDLQKEGFSLKLKSYMFLRYNLDRKTLITSLLALGGEIGKPISEIIKVLWNTYDEFNNFNEEIKIDELKLIEGVFSSSEAVIGSTYENDSLSKFLYELIDRLKDAVQDEENVNIEPEDLKKEYKTVLVIDDLDRLDPDHIFRLFNIFSAHTHAVTGENKFGFDKILFVCDIENIRKIYAHKYGDGVDFSGYMDKFYSIRPFEFDHKEHLSRRIWEIIKGCEVFNIEDECINSDWFKDSLVGVVKILLNYKLLTIRSLKQLNILKINAYSPRGSDFELQVVKGIVIINVLRALFGSIELLREKIALIDNTRLVIAPNGMNYRSNSFMLTDTEYIFLLGTFLPFLDKDFYKNDMYERYPNFAYIEELDVSVEWLREGNSCKGAYVKRVYRVLSQDSNGNVDKSENVKIAVDSLLSKVFFKLLKEKNI